MSRVELEKDTEPLVEIRFTQGKGFIDFVFVRGDYAFSTVRVLTENANADASHPEFALR